MIRRYQPGDEIYICKIFKDAVFEIAAKDYTPEQISAWANPSMRDENYWRIRCETKHPFVFEQDGRVIGFFEMDPNGHINCTYVNPANAKRGVMSDLMEEAMRYALKTGIKRLYAEVSITAVPFFEVHGFNRVQDNETVIGDVSLKSFTMETHLSKYFEDG